MKHLFPLILSGMCALPFISPAVGQQRYLVSSDDEVLRLNHGDDAQRVTRRPARPSDTQVCFDKFYFGYDNWQSYTFFRAKHDDVLGLWFVAKATGVIDTIFWKMGSVATDSTVYVRVHRSFIGPEYGPGIRPGPYAPPCQRWGYWINTNNPDGGITAFPEDATDTAWQSTIVGSPVPSTPLLGEQLWGATGVPVAVKRGANFVPMDVLTGPIPVTTGDVFFISFEDRGDDSSASDFYGDAFLVTTSDEDYPSRLWKYYAHGGEGRACGTIPSDSLAGGWIAFGGFFGDSDSTHVSVLNVMYNITVTENVPPSVVDFTGLHTTFDAGPRPFSAIIEDCNPLNPPNAGVAGAALRYSVNGTAMPDLPLVDAGADVFTSTIPGQPVGSSVTYEIVAWDFDGDTGRGAPCTYSVIPYGTEWYRIDTGYACNVRDISSTGTDVPPSGFFLPPTAPVNALATDHGTAGPVDMGSSFTLFGKQFRYAWIGVNGAMALSAGPTDTQDVNANGMWLPTGSSAPWTIPGPSKEGRGDSLTAAGMPEIYIAPLGAEHILSDSMLTYGRILFGDAGDSCLFIVQWDSMGALFDWGAIDDITTFRAVLNRCDGSVEFQYESVGWSGLDSSNLTGMQVTPELARTPGPGYVALNRLGYPSETRPRDGSCVRLSPAAGMVVSDGWSLVSLPVIPKNGDFRTALLFPELESRMYSYPYGMPPPETVAPGTGYWVKSDTTLKIGRVPGALFHDMSVAVRAGWNLIGGPSDILPAGSIVPTGTAVSSFFFGYGSGGYHSAPSLEPGCGYWVRVTGDGTLSMNAWGSAPLDRQGAMEAGDVSGFNPITFTDAMGRSQTLYLAGADRSRKDPGLFELPPPSPEGSFDIRFASGKWVESFPGDGGTAAGLPVSLRGAAFPLTVRWDLRQGAPAGSTFVLEAPGGGAGIPMEGTGATVLADPQTVTVTISLRVGGAAPGGFSLDDNYPNPFNPSTVIRYSVAKAVFVSLKVFNLIGEEVATLVAEELAPGDHSAEWRPDGLPSGVYFCRLTAGEFTGTKKLVFMK